MKVFWNLKVDKKKEIYLSKIKIIKDKIRDFFYFF